MMSTHKGRSYAVIYTWPTGREEVRYHRPVTDSRCAWEVARLRRMARAGGWDCRYSVRRTNDDLILGGN